jgi:hypothetical protein
MRNAMGKIDEPPIDLNYLHGLEHYMYAPSLQYAECRSGIWDIMAGDVRYKAHINFGDSEKSLGLGKCSKGL